MIDQMLLQNVIAYAVIFFAVLWLVRRVYRTVRAGLSAGKGSQPVGCAGCAGSKATAAAPRVKPLVQIGLPSQPNAVSESKQRL